MCDIFQTYDDADSLNNSESSNYIYILHRVSYAEYWQHSDVKRNISSL